MSYHHRSATLLLLLMTTISLHAEDMTFPANSGVIDARGCGAKGDGVTDDTAALQSALAKGVNKHAIVFLANGVYRVHDTLAWRDPAEKENGGWGRYLSIQGQSMSKTIIRLIDGSAGFGDSGNPKALVMTASGDDTRVYNDATGEGNQAFENHLWNLTLDVGARNPGAIGIDYQVSNWGALRDVSILAKAGSGHTGISLLRRDNGPGLIQHVLIDGFRRALATDQEICQMTIEHLELKNQSEVGIDTRDSILAIRDLASTNSVPALVARGHGLVVLLDSNLRSASKSGTAIENADGESRMVIRNLTTSGYIHAVANRGQAVDGVRLLSWNADADLRSSATAQIPDLPPREAPTPVHPPMSEWTGVGPASGTDDTAMFQAALDAGKAVVYVRSGRYHISRTLTIPPSVRRIIGMGVSLGASGEELKSAPLFTCAAGAAGDALVIERMEIYAPQTMRHDGARTVVMRDLRMDAYQSGPHAGSLFIDNVSGGPWHLSLGQTVFARNWNVECPPPSIVNHGARIWCLGFKTESGETVIENRDGGVATYWGGFCYTFGGIPQQRPAFINVDG